MNKNLEELKKISENENNFKDLRLQDFTIYYLIPILEDFEKELAELNNKVKGLIELYKDIVISEAHLEERIKRLEQKDTYYPMSDEGIREFKVGGTD